jgi:hypothetical protein
VEVPETAPEAEKEPETIPALPADIEDEEALRQWYIKHVMKPTIGVDQSPWSDFGAFQYELPEKKLWNKPLGKNFCIIDIDNRPWDKEGELWADKFMSWDQDRRQKVHGLSLGILNHWLYCKFDTGFAPCSVSIFSLTQTSQDPRLQVLLHRLRCADRPSRILGQACHHP